MARDLQADLSTPKPPAGFAKTVTELGQFRPAVISRDEQVATEARWLLEVDVRHVEDYHYYYYYFYRYCARFLDIVNYILVLCTYGYRTSVQSAKQVSHLTRGSSTKSQSKFHHAAQYCSQKGQVLLDQTSRA